MRSGDRAWLVVVVEDDDSIRQMICDLLASSGLGVVGCRNGMEGLSAVRRLRPAAVTLDLNLPGMDGIELLDQLSMDESTASIPVVVISTNASDHALRSRSQVKEIVQKPFDVDVLCRKVLRVIDSHAA